MSFSAIPVELLTKLIKISQPLRKAEKRKIFIVFSLGVEGGASLLARLWSRAATTGTTGAIDAILVEEEGVGGRQLGMNALLGIVRGRRRNTLATSARPVDGLYIAVKLIIKL